MNIYFSGIGGKALAPLANLVLDAGHRVFGSDPHIDPAIEQLIKRGIDFSCDQSGEFLRQIEAKHGIDWIIYTSALAKDHPELRYAQTRAIKCTKRDQFLPEFIRQQQKSLIAVAGTHGKTTTTTMLIWLFQQLNIPLSYSVGSDLNFAPAGKFNPKSQFFVYECDEFDHNFLHYHPDFALLPAITYDHKEHYPSIEDYRANFAQFISQSKQAWLWQRDFYPEFRHLTQIKVLHKVDERFQRFGERNRENATLVLNLIRQIRPDLDENTIIKIIDQTPQPGRRFEELTKGLFSDYGHLPDEIRAVLNLAQEYAKANHYADLTVVYQPYQNRRQYQIYTEYPDVFKNIHNLYWAPVSLIRETAKERKILSTKFLTHGLPQAVPVELNDDLVEKIKTALAKHHLVLFIAGGGGDEWLRQQLAKIKN